MYTNCDTWLKQMYRSVRSLGGFLPEMVLPAYLANEWWWTRYLYGRWLWQSQSVKVYSFFSYLHANRRAFYGEYLQYLCIIIICSLVTITITPTTIPFLLPLVNAFLSAINPRAFCWWWLWSGMGRVGVSLTATAVASIENFKLKAF